MLLSVLQLNQSHLGHSLPADCHRVCVQFESVGTTFVAVLKLDSVALKQVGNQYYGHSGYYGLFYAF